MQARALTTVVSVRGIKGAARAALEADPDFVYVGRKCAGWPASIWGNPWKVGSVHPMGGAVRTAEHAVILYQTETLGIGGAPSHLTSRIAELRGKKLGCWCCHWDGTGEPPNPCHAVVLARLANRIQEGPPCPG